MKKVCFAALAAFSLQAHALYITVNSPDGGEIFSRGQALPIKWVDNVSENVKIELMNGENSFKVITSTTESDGQYDWQLPFDLPAGANYKIKISSTLLSNITDQSNAPFTVKQGSIEITNPNGSTNYAKGSSCNIEWSDDILENVRIDLFKNGVIERTISSSTESDGQFNWQIPSTGIEAVGGYQIKIISTVTESVLATSNSFAITGGYIEGGISGIWSKEGSPYIIGADVFVPADKKLVIEPGTEVLFNAPAQFSVQGTLLAQGTKEEKIRFRAADSTKHWYGLNFEKGNKDTSKVEFAEITGVKADSWIREYGEGQFNDIVATDDGGYLAVGSGDANLVKLNSNFEVEWSKKVGDEIRCIEKFGDDFLVGEGESLYAGSGSLAKIDYLGKVIWQKNVDFIPLDIGISNNSTIFVCGRGESDQVLAFDHNGSILWGHNIINYFNGTFNKIFIDDFEKHIYVFGGGNGSGDRPAIAKISINGIKKWVKNYDTYSYRFFDDIIRLSNGNFLALSANEFYALRVSIIDPDGVVISKKTYNNCKVDNAYSGGQVVAINEREFLFIDSYINEKSKYFNFKFDENYDMTFMNNLKTTRNCFTSKYIINKDGLYNIVGNISNYNASNYTFKYTKTISQLNVNHEFVENMASTTLSTDKAMITNSQITANQSPAIYANHSAPIITNNLITHNQGVFKLNNASPMIANNTIADNKGYLGTVLFCDSTSSPTFINNICYNNQSTTGTTIHLNDTSSDPNFLYNNLPSGKAAIGGNGGGVNFSGQFMENSDTDPQFVGKNDYRLKATSPAINAGYPGLDDKSLTHFGLSWFDLLGNPRLYNERIDMGAFEYISNVRLASGLINENINWYEDTVKVTGDIEIASGAMLLINKGTTVEFMGNYGITVKGKIKANGNANEKITFYIKDGSWKGITYPENNDTDSSFFKNCVFTNSYTEGDGGLFNIQKGNKIVISDCEVGKNGAKGAAGAIGARGSKLQIINTVFNQNSAGTFGGAILLDSCEAVLLNNTIVNNQAKIAGGAMALKKCSTRNYNTIFWGNTAPIAKQIYLMDKDSDPNFTYCNLEGGEAAFGGDGAGENFSGLLMSNLTTDPKFETKRTENNFKLQATSPCIDAGAPVISGLSIPLYDIDGNPRLNGNRIDMGAFEYTVVNVNPDEPPVALELHQNYPNPFNPSTTITFNLPVQSKVELVIYNIKGEFVTALVKGELNSGNHQAIFNGAGYNSGLYFYKLSTPEKTIVKKMMLLK